MKISRPDSVFPPPPGPTRNSPAVNRTPSAGAIAEPALGQVADRLRARDEIDAGKVAAVREAIASGKLPLDLDQLAEAVLDLHRR
ncbi:MAG: flagellar biosynthesis anti-sigma factor FlgM [Spongiibacteraceae bacterium]|jgi:flagellar biosynthesis anti-sigma factor FlgM|nr:flagellar biosynthesis anti-sigma factor FlgM [Spongiibacteraceae bacterium]